MYEFLNNFQRRMKNVSASALLHKSVVYKDTLSSTFGFTEYDEQLNLVYALLQYIMHKSLKEEDCTLDDMAEFLEEINLEYFKKDIKRESYVNLANFIVNDIVLNDGNMTFFRCLNPTKKEFNQVYVQLIGHKRTNDSNMATYYLTEEGYNLLLSTLEFEDNMSLSVQELIFKINLENKDYDKALNDVKNIFALSKKQVQALLDNIVRIKENIMTFTAEDYERAIQESIKVIKEQDEKFKAHKEEIERRERDLRELHSQQEDALSSEETVEILSKIEKLSLIKKELSRVTYEHSKIINVHFEFKDVYTKALLNSIEYSKKEMVNIKEDLEDTIIKDLSNLDLIPILTAPLFIKDINKTYNLNACLIPQKQRKVEEDTSQEVSLCLDEEEYLQEKEEKERKAKEKTEKYKNVIKVLFKYALVKKEEFTLSDIINYLDELDSNDIDLFIPDVYILREVLIELLFMKEFTIKQLKNDLKKVSKEPSHDGSFEPLRIIVELANEIEDFKLIDSVSIKKPSNKESIEIAKNSKTLNAINISFNFNFKDYVEQKLNI